MFSRTIQQHRLVAATRILRCYANWSKRPSELTRAQKSGDKEDQSSSSRESKGKDNDLYNPVPDQNPSKPEESASTLKKPIAKRSTKKTKAPEEWAGATGLGD